MDLSNIQTALGLLQEDPYDQQAWDVLRGESAPSLGELAEVLHLMRSARDAHRERGEWDAVAALLEVEVGLAAGSPEQLGRLLELARTLHDELFDAPAARTHLVTLLDADPGDAAARELFDDIESRTARWQELRDTYLEEAAGAPDDVYRASMLMRAAEAEVRYGGGDASRAALLERLEQAIRFDPSMDRAVRMLETILRKAERWDDVARLLERVAERAPDPAMKVAAGLRALRVFDRKLGNGERAAAAAERVLVASPGRSEATRWLVAWYERAERWADLAGMYERELKGADLSQPDHLGELLQIAMLHWRKRGRADDAEAWFDKIRRLEPTSPLVLNFYREYCEATGDDARLLGVLQAAHRALPEGQDKALLAAELTRLVESQESAQKAIEQHRSALRQDPNNEAAREALKVLYRKTEGYNALVELLRQQLERTPTTDQPTRLGILREVARIYRNHLKSDTALVSVLNQIVQLDEKVDADDVEELRELIGLYEKLGRWRDLLTQQQRLAEVTPDLEEKRTLYRAMARRWLEQFSNAQNATEAYEALLAASPEDAEARERLDELYRKRRAWPALYDLYTRQLETARGSERLLILKELAQLAAERLNRGPDAVQLYRQILDLDPTKVDVLDALEKQAERAKDWATLADALERRTAMLGADPAAVAVLQKLGGVYADQLADPAGAARTWRRVLTLQPGHARALRTLRDTYLAAGEYDALEELYTEQGDFEALADVFNSAADKAKETPARVELSYRAAAVYEDRLAQPERAIRSYERVLAAEPTDARAAGKLVPLFEADEKWQRLPPLYEVQLAATTDVSERLALLGKLIQVTGERLGDRKAAVEHARRAYEAAPDDAATLEQLEVAARAAGNFEPLVAAMEKRLAELPPPVAGAAAEPPRKKKKKGKRADPGDDAAPAGDPHADTRRSLQLKLALVQAEELGKIDEAVALFRGMLEADPSDDEAAAGLESLLRRSDRRDELRWLLDLRVNNAADDEARAGILTDWATLEEDAFQAPERAVALYRRVLEVAPGEAAAVRALPRLLLGQGDAAGAAEVIEQNRESLVGDDRADREVELAELYAQRLGRPADALAAAARALALRPDDARAIQVLKGLLAVSEVRAASAELLSEAWQAAGAASEEAQAVEVMLETATGRERRLELFDRLATVHQTKASQPAEALAALLRAVGEFPDEIDLWTRADELARAADRDASLAEAYRKVLGAGAAPAIEIELCERAARLFEDRLGDPVGAAPFLERVVTVDPGNSAAFRRLKDIYTASEKWSELEALYDRATTATEDPVRRAEMLNEVALISEEIIEDGAKATRYYERILEIDPRFEPAVRALDRLYAQQQRWPELGALVERRLDDAVGDELLGLKVRLSRLLLEQLGAPARALPHVADVLSERPADADARHLAERLLDFPELRGEAARLLESVYEERDDVAALVRVLRIRLESLDQAVEHGEARADEQRELLRRIANLLDERLKDDRAAFDVMARLVPADPVDPAGRQRLLEIARRLGEHSRAAAVLSQAADTADTPGLKAEILMTVAAIQEDHLGDVPAAEQTYQRVLGLSPDDGELVLPAARALERIYLAQGAHQRLVEVLRTQVRLEHDADTRRLLLGRVGELSASLLDDAGGAIDAWAARVEDDPSDGEALAALDGLYERAGQWRQLVEVLDRRRQLTDDPAARRSFSMRQAATLGDKLAAVDEAIEAWNAVVDEHGPEAESLAALERLYRAAERWDDLADTFDRHLDIVTSDAERLDLLAALGDVRRERQENLDGALEAYRTALTYDPRHAPSRAALEAMLAHPEPTARRDAAAVLHPIYEADGAWEALLRVLDIQVETADTPTDRLEALEKAARTAEGPLGDPARAFGFAERGVNEAKGGSDLAPWLERLERLAEATGRHADQVRVLSGVVDDVFDGELQAAITLRIAELCRHKLGDRELAKQWYGKVLEVRADDRTALLALEQIYDEGGDAERLLETLERRYEAAESDAERKQLGLRRAQLLAEAIKDPPRAIEVYEALLDLGVEPDVTTPLEALYTSTERWGPLVELYQRQLSADPGGAPALLVKMARVAAVHEGDLPRAFDDLERALEIDPQHAGAVAELERLMAEAADPESRARAAGLLEPVYLVRSDYDKVLATLSVRLSHTQDPSERRELLTRLAQLHEEQKEDYSAALETMATLLADDPSDAGTLSELERLARVAGAEKRLAEVLAAEVTKADSLDEGTSRLARRAAELFEGQGDLARSLEFFRRALAFEPENRGLFASVDSLLERTAAHAERVELYRGALEHRFDPEDRRAALHVIAGLQRGVLSQPDEAIQTYREIVEVDSSDARALDALAELYAQRERWSELAELELERAGASAAPDVAARHRLAGARLQLHKLGQVGAAIDSLEEILRSNPGNTEALAELEVLRDDPDHKERVVEILRPLYESLDDWRHLIKLNEDRFALASEVGEKVAVLKETASLWESRGGDRLRARRALGAAVRLDPEDGGARAEYERLVAADEAWEELADTYEVVLEEQPDLGSRIELLEALAQAYDRHLDDPRSALGAYQRLWDADRGDAAPLTKLDELGTLLADWPVVVGTLEARTELTFDDGERASLLRRIGETRRDMLDDLEGAVSAYEKALELDVESAHTVDSLISLYEERKSPERLVALYERRLELTPDDDLDLRYQLGLGAGRVLEEQLQEPGRAIESYQQALAARPGDPDALRRVNRLLRAEERWPELLDNLRIMTGTVQTAAERAEVRREMGDVLAGKMESFDEALEAYQTVLDEVPDDRATIDAVRALGQAQEELRERVAGILIPVLRAAHQHEPLVDALELRLSTEQDPAQRADTLRTIAEVLERDLGRPAQALEALLRALRERPAAADLHADAARLAAAAGAWVSYADVLAEQAPAAGEPEQAGDLWVRLGQVAEEHLKDVPRATEAYARAVEQLGDRRDLLAALDRLYAAADDFDKLAEVLERRTALAETDADRADLAFRTGTLQVERFQQHAAGLASFRKALELVADHAGATAELEKLTARRDLFADAAEALERVYRAQGQRDRLAGLYEQRVAFAAAGADRVEALQALARILEEHCGDNAGAQKALQRAMGEDPAASAPLAELERLAAMTGDWASAAAALEAALQGSPRLTPEAKKDLGVRLAGWRRDRLNDAAGAEAALQRALAATPDADDVLLQLEQLQRGAEGRERDLVETLRRRAKLQSDDSMREHLYQAAFDFATELSDPELSEAVARELLASDDGNLWALTRLTELREKAGDFKAVLELLVRRADLGASGSEVRALRHRAATVAREKLADPAGAIALYAQLFEDDPADAQAASGLRELYSATSKHQELARLLERLVELADGAAARSPLRIELAQLHAVRFKAVDPAIELLRTVIAEDPTSSEAVVQLSALYEQTGKDAELAELLAGQIEAARSRGDSDAELRFQVRLGEVYDSRLKDRTRAIQAYRSVLDRNPSHTGALQALARLHQAEGDHAGAAGALERLLDAAEGDEAAALAVSLTGLYAKLNDDEAAARALERGLSRAPAASALRDQLRSLYEKMKAWDRLADMVVADAERAEAIDDKVKLLRSAADIHAQRRSDHGAAANVLARASELRPDDRELQLALCDAYSASGRGKDAAAVLEQIVESFGGKRSKELGEIHRRLATAYLADENVPRALEELDKAFRIEPGNVAVLKQLGEVAMLAGEWPKAQQMYRALLLQKLDDKSPITKAEVFMRLGEVHMALGETPKAIQQFERAVQTDATLERAKELLARARG